MRLHHLQIEAFGPFGGTEKIDFDALGAHGLFLMHGPTGSGKTTVLDAICFAVFAAVPGARRGQTDRLSSDHAQPGHSPRVRLEFTVAGRRLRVTRSPKHFVAKKRGSGQTPRQASVLLEEREQHGWKALSTRADETAAVLDELLGLGLEQFAQVVLLPQGEFAAFLRAKADDRAALLQKLFDISRFADLEDWLADRRRTVRAELTESDRAIRTALVRAEESLVELAPEIEQWRTSAVEELPEQIGRTADRTSGQLTAAMATAERTARAAEQAAASYERTMTLLGLQRQGAKAGEVWARWEQEADARAATEARLAAHERAAEVNPWLRAKQRAQARRQELDRDALVALTAVQEQGIAEPESAGERLSAAASSLAEAAEADRAVHRIEQEAPRARTALNTVKATLSSTRTRSEQLRERGKVLATTVTAARATLDSTRDLDRREALLKDWEQTRSALVQAERVLERTADEQTTAARIYADAEAEVLQLRSRRLAGFAGELALELAPGRPCAVCGSVEHPAPASAAQSISAEAVAEAESVAATARAAHERAQAHHVAAVATAANLTDRCEQLADHWHEVTGTVLDPATVQELRDQVDAQRRADDEAARVLADAERELAELTPRVQALDDQQRAGEQELARAHALEESLDRQLTEATARRTDALARHAQQCPCTARHEVHPSDQAGDAAAPDARAAGGPNRGGELDRAVARHELVNSLLAAWQHASSDASDAAANLDEATRELAAQLDAHAFTGEDEVASALLPTDDERALRAALRTAHEAALRARGVLDQPEVAAALEAEPARPEMAEEERRDAQAADRLAQAAFGAAQRAVTSLERLRAEVDRLLSESDRLRELMPTLDRIADLVTGAGDNALRMRLSAYVLAARLEEITVLANHQLEIMSAGRYRLEHTDARAKGGARSGLGLVVRDSWTGTARDTATLSGGETFMVSLALALALGQAVLHDSGGRPLETLLVDEGFGSLDDESLELVMQVLDELRSGGRTVGIVSHVGELRSRVPAQIRVHKTEQGSRVEVHVGDASSAA